ncbi:MAG: hypothetical protein KIS66_05885 [Fimbriimonadaceae bacterium]|nr:hypothetical protein [Fimbriimonadaceae bacterium]
MWKVDWDLARDRFVAWWSGTGCALHVTAIKDEPWDDVPEPAPPATLEQRWLEPAHRLAVAEDWMSRTYYGGTAFPYFDTEIGPGSLGLLLGGIGRLAPTTVWYEPTIHDPDLDEPLRLDRSGEWWKRHWDLIELGMARANGRYLVGVPDLIENVDTLAQLRDPQTLLMDLVERPDWVERRLDEINQAFFEVMGEMYQAVRDPWDGQAFAAFQIWGPGKTAKVQCDAAAMISPAMFDRFVVPRLAEQCAWLDYSMFHLDGTQAFPHLDSLLAIPDLKAIEWTPQTGLPTGGDPCWYDLYRRIKAGGKAVQAIGVRSEEVLPLLDAVGPEGMFVMTWAESEAEARDLVRRVYG